MKHTPQNDQSDLQRDHQSDGLFLFIRRTLFMINHSVIRAFILCALVAPSINAMDQQENSAQYTYPQKQSPFAQYSPLALGAGTIGLQLLWGGPLTLFSNPDWNIPLFQYGKENPTQTIITFAAMAGSAYALHRARDENNNTKPLERINNNTCYVLPYVIPSLITGVVGTVASIGTLFPLDLNPLLIASVSAVGVASLWAKVMDNIIDQAEYNLFKNARELKTKLFTATGKKTFGLNDEENAKNQQKIENTRSKLTQIIESVDPDHRYRYFDKKTLNLYDSKFTSLNPKVAASEED